MVPQQTLTRAVSMIGLTVDQFSIQPSVAGTMTVIFRGKVLTHVADTSSAHDVASDIAFAIRPLRRSGAL